jgi:limonene-1,2-epoxide hydrolase
MTPTEAIDIASARVAFGRVVLPRQSKDDAAINVARSFLEGFGTWDDVFATIERWCADDCVWETPALPPSKGKEAMLAFAKGFQAQSAIARMQCTFRNISAAGGTVLTERVDHLWNAEGNLITSLAVCGVLEVRDGLVVSFREYFDTGKGHV